MNYFCLFNEIVIWCSSNILLLIILIIFLQFKFKRVSWFAPQFTFLNNHSRTYSSKNQAVFTIMNLFIALLVSKGCLNHFLKTWADPSFCFYGPSSICRLLSWEDWVAQLAGWYATVTNMGFFRTLSLVLGFAHLKLGLIFVSTYLEVCRPIRTSLTLFLSSKILFWCLAPLSCW